MLKLLVDGVFFQLNNTGISRVWMSILPLLARSDRFEIFLLDRGGAPAINGINFIPFPKSLPAYTADDSILIQRVCDHFKIDAFTSTYYTTPLRTPMVLMIYDMIPELFDFNLGHRNWMEKEIAISFAQRYVCISNNTRRDLLALYSELPVDRVSVAHCGVDADVFYPRSGESVAAFRRRYALDRAYFILVGSRVQHNRYKNTALFFDSIAPMNGENFDVLCVGGEKEMEPEILEKIPQSVRCFRLDLSDDELATAYSGAAALIYPSLYEGFGMPVIEAMASGCPVITTSHGSLSEAAGNAACLISGASLEEMRDALVKVQNPAYSNELKSKGRRHAQQFNWHSMANTFSREAEKVVEEYHAGGYKEFFKVWQRLRKTQANVDIE